MFFIQQRKALLPNCKWPSFISEVVEFPGVNDPQVGEKKEYELVTYSGKGPFSIHKLLSMWLFWGFKG